MGSLEFAITLVGAGIGGFLSLRCGGVVVFELSF